MGQKSYENNIWNPRKFQVLSQMIQSFKRAFGITVREITFKRAFGTMVHDPQ